MRGGLYLDARSPNRLSGPEEAEEAVGTECKGGEKKKDIRSLLCHPAPEDPKDMFPTPVQLTDHRGHGGVGWLAEPLDPRISVRTNAPLPGYLMAEGRLWGH